MALTGTLRTWHEDRGFGFIAPANGGREVFVHISAFPRDGSRPTVGETLTYDLGRGKDGKPQAVRVVRQALGQPSSYPRTRATPARRRSSFAGRAIGLALIVGLGAAGYTQYQSHSQRQGLLQPETSSAIERPQVQSGSPGASFRCDGRTHCSQMTSCAEAKFFLQHCPGVKMDGNNDGVPCEQQWCTSPFAE